ncbi:hypothetical protein [Nonomuraea typhae]|uniref:hypothetical protein n=1 Tax=Nonomuraea typhae TaxID=2603600 RepID=UPI0012F9FC3D|nr:hypothetical protein [Nonomuraea typhae]
MSPKEQALRLAVVRVLKDLLAAADAGDREQVAAEWLPGDRLGGAINRQAVGHVQLKNGTKTASVTDPKAFENWVTLNRPEEWETITTTRVRPAYLSAVLDAAKKTGDAVTSDGEPIPGITVKTGDPTVAVTLANDAHQVVRQAWESGELWELIGSVLPALDPTPGPAEPVDEPAAAGDG